MRVLVTGFNDWRDLGETPNVWRCRDNPSGRLLVGDERHDRPDAFDGPLPTRLRSARPSIDWRFATMPVVWDAIASVGDDVDVMINLGLGVYDRDDVLQLEVDAFNLLGGTDASGQPRKQAIDSGGGDVLTAPRAVAGKINRLIGQNFGRYTVTTKPARADNCYLCNQTHYLALKRVAGDGPLTEAYFVHIPYAAGGDYESLTDGVAGLVLALVV